MSSSCSHGAHRKDNAEVIEPGQHDPDISADAANSDPSPIIMRNLIYVSKKNAFTC